MNQSFSFVIDALPLYQTSRKPHHLQKRMKKRSMTPTSLSEAEFKRQALLEARTKKLAKHADHVKEVCQTIKKQTRQELEEKKILIEKQLEVAEKNRNHLLQQQIEQYAQQNQKVMDVKQKHEQSHHQTVLRKKMELEERQITSHFRRTALSKVPRSKLLDDWVVEIEMLRMQNASKTIQRWWKQLKLQTLITKFIALDLLPMNNLTFTILMTKVQSKKTISVTSKLLLFLKKQSPVAKKYKYKNPTKVFLSSFMLVKFPEEIMPQPTEEEIQIQQKAEKMLKTFEKFLLQSRNAEPFLNAWHDFHVSFEEWKIKDTEKMLDSMFHHFMELERLWETVRHQVDATAEWKPRIEMQQQQIKDKVLKIGGKSALKKFLDSQQELRDSSDASDAETVQENKRSNSVLGSLQPPTTSKAEAPALRDLLSSFQSEGFSNELLAHELILNPDFELKPKEENSLEAQIKKIAKKAFFDHIQEKIQHQNYDWAPALVADIRQQLLDMVSPQSAIAKSIQELDLSLIQQQIENKVFDLQQFIQLVTSWMLQLCAPIRDQQIRRIPEEQNLVEQLKMILLTLEEMKLDLANYRLKALRPHLMPQAIEYEQEKFKKALEEGKLTLEKTVAWLLQSTKKMEQVAAQRNPQNIDLPENQVRLENIYFDALLGLIFSPDPIQPATAPETLLMDVERLFDFQNEIQALTVVASVLMLTRNFIQEIRDCHERIEQLKNELFLILKDPETTLKHISSHLIASMNEVLSSSQKPELSQDQEKWIENMVEKTLSYKDTVYLLLNRRMQHAVRLQLSSGRFRRDSNNGLETVQEEMENLSRKIFLLAKHNRSVYAPWYDEIIHQQLNQN